MSTHPASPMSMSLSRFMAGRYGIGSSTTVGGILSAVVAITALATLPTSAVAQAVGGTVVDAATDARVDGARVVLVDENGAERAAAVADTAGEFRLEATAPGRYRLRAERLGYAETVSDPVEVAGGEVVVVVLRMST